MKRPGTFTVDLPPQMLERGFWLYVWRVTVPRQRLHYVGRTGDNSSPFAVSPYKRMGQHLGSIETQNALLKHLRRRNLEPQKCKKFEFICHGPIHPEVLERDMDAHLPLRNAVGALEKKLATALRDADYTVLNDVKWPHDYDPVAWRSIVRAFKPHFPRLK